MAESVPGGADLAGVRTEGAGRGHRVPAAGCYGAARAAHGDVGRRRPADRRLRAGGAHVGGLVAPTIPYGYKSQPRSGGGEAFRAPPASTPTPSRSSSATSSAARPDGVRRLVVVNGHFENCWPAVEGVDLALRELRRDGIADMQVMRLEYWDFVQRSTLDGCSRTASSAPSSSMPSLLETRSCCLLRPDLVDMEKVPDDGPARFPTYDRHPVPKGFVPASGVLARAERPRPSRGSGSWTTMSR